MGNRNVKEALAIALALSERHNWTYEALIGALNMLNTILGAKYLPSSKKLLWKALGRSDLGIERHTYCKRCYASLGLHQRLPPGVINCPNVGCPHSDPKRHVPYFLEMSLKKQLLNFLERPDAADLLFSKYAREKHNEDALEDIYDGRGHESLQSENNPILGENENNPILGGNGNNIILGENDFTYKFNCDGLRVTTTSGVQVYPIYIGINELLINCRQKHLFLAGVWCSRGDPDMVLYLHSLVRQLNKLSRNGLTWNAGRRGVVTSKFIPACCCVDSKARCIMLNMAPPTGYFGCTFCPIHGIQANGVKFTMLEVMPPLRTHTRLDNLMQAAYDNNYEDVVELEGVHGLSPLCNLRYFNMVLGMTTDDLHPFFEGAVKFHMELLLGKAEEDFYIGAPLNIATINARLNTIKPPTLISRTPRPIDNRKKYRGHEWRNLILYYAVPCLQGVLPEIYLNHLKLLSRAIFLVSKDSILPEDILEAERCFRLYVTDFQNLFGEERMRFNIHVLLHAVEVVCMWGPTFAHSTFPFESWNMRVKKDVTSMKDPLLQIANRHLIHKFISNVPFEKENFSLSIRQEVKSIMDHINLKRVATVGNVHLLGNPTIRVPSQEEIVLLHQEGYNYHRVTEYQRVLKGRLEIRSTKYTRESKSNNSHIYTWDDKFCRVKSIISVGQGVDTHTFMFVQVLNISEPDNILSHMVKLQVQQDNALERCIFDNVRVFALHIACGGHSFNVPMPNCCEID